MGLIEVMAPVRDCTRASLKLWNVCGIALGLFEVMATMRESHWGLFVLMALGGIALGPLWSHAFCAGQHSHLIEILAPVRERTRASLK